MIGREKERERGTASGEANEQQTSPDGAIVEYRGPEKRFTQVGGQATGRGGGALRRFDTETVVG